MVHSYSACSICSISVSSFPMRKNKEHRDLPCFPCGTMNIWHTGNEHTTPSTSQSPSDLIPRTRTVDLINLLVCANVYVLHSNTENTFSSVTCSTQSPFDNMLWKAASETGENITSTVPWVNTTPCDSYLSKAFAWTFFSTFPSIIHPLHQILLGPR